MFRWQTWKAIMVRYSTTSHQNAQHPPRARRTKKNCSSQTNQLSRSFKSICCIPFPMQLKAYNRQTYQNIWPKRMKFSWFEQGCSFKFSRSKYQLLGEPRFMLGAETGQLAPKLSNQGKPSPQTEAFFAWLAKISLTKAGGQCAHILLQFRRIQLFQVDTCPRHQAIRLRDDVRVVALRSVVLKESIFHASDFYTSNHYGKQMLPAKSGDINLARDLKNSFMWLTCQRTSPPSIACTWQEEKKSKKPCRTNVIHVFHRAHHDKQGHPDLRNDIDGINKAPLPP